jgi:hypothetical protein
MKKIFIHSLAVLFLFQAYEASAQCGGPVTRTAYLVGLQYNTTTGNLFMTFGMQNNSNSQTNVQILAYTSAFRFDTAFMSLDRSFGNSYYQAFGAFIVSPTGPAYTNASYTYDHSNYSQYNGTDSWQDVIDQRSSNQCADIVPVTSAGGAEIFYKYIFHVSDWGQAKINSGDINVLDPCNPKFILKFINSSNYTVPAADSSHFKLLVYALGNNQAVSYKGIRLEARDNSGSNCTGIIGSTQGIPTGTVTFDAGGIIVPVKYSAFNVTKRGSKSAYITWTTESESTNLGFTVERRTKAGFETIGFIASRGVNGNSAATLNYEFTDANIPASGVVYYRIKQTELSGKVEYTGVKAIRLDGAFAVSVYPNPAKGITNITIPENKGGVDIFLTDNFGRIVNRWMNVTETSKQIEIKNPGYYFLKVVSKSSGEQYTEKIVVN